MAVRKQAHKYGYILTAHAKHTQADRQTRTRSAFSKRPLVSGSQLCELVRSSYVVEVYSAQKFKAP